MSMEKEREEIVAYGRKLLESGLTKGTGGNLSLRDETGERFAISPSGIPYEEMSWEDVVVLSLEGEVLEGSRKPSSETEMHRLLYLARKDIRAVIHSHTVFATTVACLNEALPPVHYMVAVAGLEVPCAPYATFGTRELAENAARTMGEGKAVLLANHGLLAAGGTLGEAFNITEEVEYVAEIYCRTRSMGTPVILPQEEMVRMLDLFQNYGQGK